MLRLILNLHLSFQMSLGSFESFVKLDAYEIKCFWVLYLNSRCFCSWHFKCKGASMKSACKNKAVVPTETPKTREDKSVESAVLMFKSSAGECCSSTCLWKLVLFFCKVREISQLYSLPFFWIWRTDRADVLQVCPLVHQLAAFSTDVCFPLVEKRLP